MSETPREIKAWGERQWQTEPDGEKWIVADGLWYLPEEPAPPHAHHYIRADIAQAELDAAVKAEREACAKVVQDMWDECSEPAAYDIAKAIRKRNND